MEQTRGTETSQYPQEEKEIIDSLSSGDRKGKSLNRRCYGNVGVVGPVIRLSLTNWNVLESSIEEGDNPVQVSLWWQDRHLSRAGHVKSCLNPRGPSRKAKYSQKTDSVPVLWRKGGKNPEQGSEIEPETVRLQAVGARKCDGVPFA